MPKGFRTKKSYIVAGRKISQTLQGHVSWNKGKKCPQLSGENNAHYWKDRNFSEEHKRRISEGKKGSVSWNKDKKCPQISESKKGKRSSPATEFKKGHEGLKGKNNPNWQDGISFEPYGLAFNKELKEQIRKRDDYKCQECGYQQVDIGYKLHCHHIDYNKKNNRPENLISLCRSCHLQTNYGREDWTSYFNQKQL